MIDKVLEKILQLNQQLIEESQQRNWESLNKLTIKRQALVENIFDFDNLQDRVNELNILQQHILDTDNKIVQTIKQCKSEEILSSIDLKKAQQALKQYHSIKKQSLVS